jgi:hypothetical protein
MVNYIELEKTYNGIWNVAIILSSIACFFILLIWIISLGSVKDNDTEEQKVEKNKKISKNEKNLIISASTVGGIIVGGFLLYLPIHFKSINQEFNKNNVQYAQK